MFNITLHLEPQEATILEAFLRSRGKQAIRRGQIHGVWDEGVFAERATVLLEVADQIKDQANRSSPPEVPFPDAPPATYTQVLDGLIKELQSRTIESDSHDDWSHVLWCTANRLERLHQGGE